MFGGISQLRNVAPTVLCTDEWGCSGPAKVDSTIYVVVLRFLLQEPMSSLCQGVINPLASLKCVALE